MVKYFMSRLIFFQEPKESEIKPESEISCHITLKCNKVFSTLDIFTEVVFFVTWCKVRETH